MWQRCSALFVVRTRSLSSVVCRYRSQVLASIVSAVVTVVGASPALAQTEKDELAAIRKLSPELQLLARDIPTQTRSSLQTRNNGSFSDGQLRNLFGIDINSTEPRVFVALTVSTQQPMNFLERFGGAVITSFQDRLIASIPVRSLEAVAALRAVRKIGVLTAGSLPRPTRVTPGTRPRTRGASVGQSLLSFDARGLSGRGVLIGIIDSGIDWRNPAFLRSDGTSRVVAIWDLTDDSFERSGGRIGTKPPVEIGGMPLGTVYTNSQLNRALDYSVTVNSRDENGHGTAVAGVAASNGRGSPRGFDFRGIAPESELLIVRASRCGGFHELAEFSTQWLFDEAERLRRPIVVNMSFGTSFSNRDGASTQEMFLDSLVGTGKKGRAITVAAGNDGRENLHAVSSFGKKGQPDEIGPPVSVSILGKGQVAALFDSRDDWRMLVSDVSGRIRTNSDGKPVVFSVVPLRSANGPQFQIESDDFDEATRVSIERRIAVDLDGETDRIIISLPEGNYLLQPQGSGSKVASGRADFYAITNDGSALFGTGVSTSELVTSPGNAAGVVTVGSYVARNAWLNQDGDETAVNVKLGSISVFSSRGFRRDGLVKPDIVAPGEWMISPLSGDAGFVGTCKDSMAAGDKRYITVGGSHVVWHGTSAATPYVAGLIALMLEKNPMLDSQEILEILKKTARSGVDSGLLPNPSWGWGAVDPERALAATPPGQLASPK